MNVFINNRNYYNWTKNIADIFATQGHKVIIVDNNSTWQPLLSWYESCPYEVVRLKKNYGCSAPWDANVIKDISDYYVTCEPDLDISMVPEDWDKYCIDALRSYNIPKIGLSLEDRDCPSRNPAYLLDKFGEYPEGNPSIWREFDINNPGKYCDYPVDYHFCVWNKNEKPLKSGTYPCGIRTNRPYTARHLPWHLVMEKYEENSYQIEMDDEICYYFMSARHIDSVTAGRVFYSNFIQKYKNYDKLYGARDTIN